jgi:competence protein ComEC
VAPRLAIVAAGYRNRFRHPSPEVMARYAGRGIEVRRTDLSGAVNVRATAEGLQIESWREARPRYWHGR